MLENARRKALEKASEAESRAERERNFKIRVSNKLLEIMQTMEYLLKTQKNQVNYNKYLWQSFSSRIRVR